MTKPVEAEETCRICLETSPVCAAEASNLSKFPDSRVDEEQLISPCGCRGTQAFVHFKCLRKWQTSVLASRSPGSNHSAALVCSVCTQKFSVAPPRPALFFQIWKSLTGYSCEVAGLCIILSACCLVLAGHNVQSVLEELGAGLTLAWEVLPCSFRFNKCSSRTCSFLGAGFIPQHLNLHPGTLLVATPAMPSPFFFGSVVLLYEHQQCSGSRGLILNMQLDEKQIVEWENKMMASLPRSAILSQIMHGMGGPVAQYDWTILNRCPCCASVLVMDTSCLDNVNLHENFPREEMGQELLPGVFLGRDISPILKHANDDPVMLGHQVLHGHAEWFVGQLWSEVKRGYWITKENASEILLSTPPHELWHVLVQD